MIDTRVLIDAEQRAKLSATNPKFVYGATKRKCIAAIISYLAVLTAAELQEDHEGRDDFTIVLDDLTEE